MGIIIASLLFGTVSGLVAHSKARNVLGWSIAGCLIGPFALVVLALPMGLKDGITRRCPQCSETIRMEARVCHHCKSDLRGIIPE